MRLTFLGTGTSQGVPIIACSCLVCRSQDKKDQRLRSSVWIRTDTQSLVIDSGPDFRQQVLRAGISRLDGILFTHHHKDHTAGLDDVRAFNYVQKKPMPIYAENYVIEAIKTEFSYAFSKNPYPGVPKIEPVEISTEPFCIGDLRIVPIRGHHYRLPVLGFRIGKMAYLTDMSSIEEAELEKLRHLDILVVNALRLEPHLSHFNLEEALNLIEKVQPKKAYLTHLSHAMGTYVERSKLLPERVFLAYDGLDLELE